MPKPLLRLTAVLLCSLSSASFAQTDVPSSYRINNIRSNGTGCPMGTIAVNVSDDQEAFTLSFSEFFAEVSPGIARTEERKNCRMMFDTEQDAGWEYSILAVNFRGYASLEAGVYGRQSLQFGAKGKSNQAILNLNGPYDDDYINTQEVGLGNLQWSGCKDNKVKDFVIDAALLLKTDNPQGRGLFTVDSVDGEIRQEYEILWRSCQAGNNKQKHFLSTCSVQATNPAKGTRQTIFGKGQGKNENKAQQKARSKISKKCSKLNKRSLACDVNTTVCQVTQL